MAISCILHREMIRIVHVDVAEYAEAEEKVRERECKSECKSVQ
jgi:hypothetical protein